MRPVFSAFKIKSTFCLSGNLFNFGKYQPVYSMRYSIPICLLTIGLMIFGCDQPNNAQKPNIIYIMADDLGYGEIGVYGQKIIQTPNIDALAEKGVKFTQHYAGTSVCAPSRCVLMTGMHMGHAEVRGNGFSPPSGQVPISKETYTVAEFLKENGYKTGMIGKWGLGEPGTSGDPNDQGFDFFFGYTDQILAHNYYPEFLWRNGEKVYLDNEVQYLDTTAWHRGLGSYSTKKVDYSPELMTTEALGFIDQNKEDPFFLYLPYTLPHDNGEAAHDTLRFEVPSLGRFETRDWPYHWKTYAASIEKLDAYVGKVTDKITELGLNENTLIIFTSDNGPYKGRAFTSDSVFASNGPFRGYKRDLYEGGIRMPFVAQWTGVIPAGTITNHASAFYDFFPTVADIIDAQPPKTDGISYLNAMLGEPQEKHEYLYFEFYEGGKSQAMVMDEWKAVRNDVFRNDMAPVELYNLNYDIEENNDISSENPEIVAQMRALMKEAHTPDPEWPLFQSEVAE